MGCGQPCVGFYCYLCTCQQCGFSLNDGTCMNCTYGDGKPVTCCECESPLNGGFCLICASRAGNSSACDPNPNSYNDSPNFSDYTPQPQYETYLCELCGNNSHYGYDCPPRFPLVYEQESCYNQNYNDNYYSHNSPSFLCCDNCGGPHETFRCQPMNQNFYTNSSGFDQIQPPQYYDMHQPPKESVKEFEEQSKTIVISALEGEFQPPQETSVEILQAKDDLMNLIQTFLKKFNHISFGETPKILLLAWEKFFEIQHAKPEDIQDLLHKLLEDLKIISGELAEFINSPSWNRPTFYDVDDDEYTIIYRSSKAITPDLSIEEPDNSLSMGDEHLSTIPEMESDKVIKSSVENLVPIPRESEGVSDDTYDVPFCVNSPLLDVLNDHFKIFSDSNNDCTSSDNDSFEDIDYIKASPPEDFLIMGNEELSTIPEKESDEFIKSSVEELIPIPRESEDSSRSDSESNIECEDSYDSNLDEPVLLVTPLSDANEDECFDPGGVIDEIDAFLDMDISTDIENGYHDSEGDIIYLESLLIDDTSPNLPLEVFLDHDPRSLKDEPDNDDLMTEDKVFDPGIYEKSFSLTFVKLTFEDRHYFPITFVIRIFLPYLTYSVDSSFLLSSGSEDTIFDPGISTFHFSSLKPVAYENPIVIFLFFCFCPKDKGIRGESS
ncbi:hypothetical protein Tco_0439452 [Tanacetum coccineum]